jgi:hypothetical protein
MSLKLEELRQRLLNPVNSSSGASPSVREASFEFPILTQEHALRGEDADRVDSEERQARSSAEITSAAVLQKDGGTAPTVQLSADPNVSVAALKADSRADVSSAAQAIDIFFEPARQCQKRLREITQSCQVIEQLACSTLALCQPLQTFGERLRKISKALLSMREFRDELNVLSESFEPIGTLSKQIAQLENAIPAQLAEIATTLESTKTMKARIAELDQSVDSVSELEVQFLELSRCFDR